MFAQRKEEIFFFQTNIVFVFGTKRKNSLKKGEHIAVGGEVGLFVWLFCF